MTQFYVYCREVSDVPNTPVRYRVTRNLRLVESNPPIDRAALVKLVQTPGVEVWTAYLDNLHLVEGEKLEVVDGFIAPYVKTRPNRITQDNLGKLGECAATLLVLSLT